MLTRRLFLKSSAFALVSVGVAPGLGPDFLRNGVLAAEVTANQRKRKTLVVIFQRGAVDGLSMVIPHGDPAYYQHRSLGGIAIPATGEGAALDLDGKFGLHPAMSALLPLYKAGHFAPIQAVGSPHATRSHFDAQDFMETAIPGDKSAKTGWLTRALGHCPEDAIKAATPMRAVAMSARLPVSFMGDEAALALGDMRSFGVDEGMGAMMGRRPAKEQKPTVSASAGFEAMYNEAVGDVLHGTGKETFDAIKMLKGINPGNYTPANGADYPKSTYGESLKQIAQLIKADMGTEVAFAEILGWDTHANQGSSGGSLARRLNEFANGLAAFYTDLGDRMSDVTLVTMSEFGRTVRQNGNSGTDHGHATCFLTLGGQVNGGKVLGKWPGLAPEQLYQNRDLEVTTDFRDVFGELANRQLAVKDLNSVFPGYTPAPSKFPGILRA